MGEGERRGVVLSCIEDNRNAQVAKTCDLVFLAVRPQDVDAVAAEVRPLLSRGQTIVSIVAGKTLAKLRKAFGTKAGLVRVMPNLALRAHAGMCARTSVRAAMLTKYSLKSGSAFWRLL